MAVVDGEARLVEANVALRALLGRPAGEHGSLPLADLVYPHDVEQTLGALAALRNRHEDVRTVDTRWVRADGSVMWAHTALVAAGADTGPRRVFAMIQDVTARKREEALAEGERRALRLLAQNRDLQQALTALVHCLERNEPDMISSILVADEDGARLRHGAAPRLDEEYTRVVDGLLIGPTAGSCGTAAHRRERVVVVDIAHDPLWAAFREAAAVRGLRACWSQPILSATGKLLGTFALYYRTPRGPTDGEIDLIEAAARAAAIVIERQRLDDLLARHRNELAHVGRLNLLAALAAGLAHEMQQPLAAIVNYAGGCERLLSSTTVDRAQLLDGLGRIHGTAMRAGEIVRSIRSLAQKREQHRERLSIEDVASSAVQLVEAEARRHGVAIKLDLADALPPVQIDRIQIEQVLLNLLSNGLEAMAAHDRGDAHLTIRSWMRDDDAIAVTVRDTGPAMSPDIASRMFDPFFTTKPLGLGMGLSIGRMIVEAHGGSMWADASAEGGTTVGFTLPTAPVRTNGHVRS
jgi:PAS domain S-box-containing protein